VVEIEDLEAEWSLHFLEVLVVVDLVAAAETAASVDLGEEVLVVAALVGAGK
jgi:hypothetical protein